MKNSKIPRKLQEIITLRNNFICLKMEILVMMSVFSEYKHNEIHREEFENSLISVGKSLHENRDYLEALIQKNLNFKVSKKVAAKLYDFMEKCLEDDDIRYSKEYWFLVYSKILIGKFSEILSLIEENMSKINDMLHQPFDTKNISSVYSIVNECFVIINISYMFIDTINEERRARLRVIE